MVRRCKVPPAVALCVLLTTISVNAFSPTLHGNVHACPGTALAAANKESHAASKLSNVVATSVVAVALTLGIAAAPALADEFGRETEAPTLFTGENVMICKKRGPLGACKESVERTAENDNDKASKYFQDPSADVKAKYDSMTRDVQSEADGNVLIQKLLQQTEENKERNDRIVKQRTLLNDQGASFGPFSGQTVILNADGEGFTLLQNSQAMRLKEAGYIKDRRFVKQPTKEVIDQALSAEGEGGGLFKSLFGGAED